MTKGSKCHLNPDIMGKKGPLDLRRQRIEGDMTVIWTGNSSSKARLQKHPMQVRRGPSGESASCAIHFASEFYSSIGTVTRTRKISSLLSFP